MNEFRNALGIYKHGLILGFYDWMSCPPFRYNGYKIFRSMLASFVFLISYIYVYHISFKNYVFDSIHSMSLIRFRFLVKFQYFPFTSSLVSTYNLKELSKISLAIMFPEWFFATCLRSKMKIIGAFDVLTISSFLTFHYSLLC